LVLSLGGIEELAAVLQRIAEAPREELREMGRHAQQYAPRAFTLKRMIDETENAYLRIAGAQSSARWKPSRRSTPR
jgi:glycosyltransferase involved in cell wall biosynthesis